MAKRKPSLRPCPPNVWYSEGHTRDPDIAGQVSQHLEMLTKLGTVAVSGPVGEPAPGFDASWRTADGAVIRARLRLRTPLATPGSLAEGTNRGVWWSLTALADQPWCEDWPSPLLQFFPDHDDVAWDKEASTGHLGLRHATRFLDEPLASLSRILDMMTACPWNIVVITHDRRPRKQVNDTPPCLVHLLPPSLMGRVVEVRVNAHQDQLVNEALEKHQVRLPRGGMVIVPSMPRSPDVLASEYRLRPPPGGDMHQMLKEAAVHVARYAQHPWHYSDRIKSAVNDLDSTWVLALKEPKGLVALKEQAEREAHALREHVSSLANELDLQIRARQDAEQAAGQARETLQKAQRAEAENPLAVRTVAAESLKEAALQESEAAQHLLDDAISEVSWLRRQLARIPGRTYDEAAPARAQGPQSWEELASLAAELMPHVQLLDDVWESLERLRRHKHESQWIRRTWECLEALEAYAAAKEEQGADVLPHFTAYLNWPGASTLVSVNLYCASEASLTGRRSRSLRMFYVPLVGNMFMQEHFRIGGSRSPAPRMHVYDDTAGSTAKVHVGYIGPHLPNNKD